MNEKKKSRKYVYLAVISLIILLFVGISVVVAQNTSINEALYQWGIIDKAANKKSGTLLYKGDNVRVLKEKVDTVAQKKVLMGMNQEVAAVESERELLTQECLYFEAIEKGYSVTDKEVKEMINKQIEAFQDDGSVENYSDYQSYLDGIGMTSEQYWNSQYDEVEKQMVSWKYMEPIYQQFVQDNSAEANEQGFGKKWQGYQDQMADNIAERDNVIRIDQ